MTQQEMYNMIKQEDQSVGANKIKRNLKFFIFVTVLFFLASKFYFKNDILDSLLLSLVSAGLYFFSGFLFWFPFFKANNSENQYLAELKKDYQQKFNETWY